VDRSRRRAGTSWMICIGRLPGQREKAAAGRANACKAAGFATVLVQLVLAVKFVSPLYVTTIVFLASWGGKVEGF